MTSYPPAPLRLQNALALDYTHSQVAYVGYEGTVFHLSGPLAPILGAQSGVVIKEISGLDSPFKHLDNKGARQDGTTWYDSLYDPGEIDMVVELGGMDPKTQREVIAAWFGAWDPKKLGKLCWFSPERGEWWCNVRMNKPVADRFTADWYQSRLVQFTWSARNDDAFWYGPDSVCTFDVRSGQAISVDATGGTYTLSVNGQTTSALPFNAAASDIQSALEALSSVGSGNVVVTALDGSGFLFKAVFDFGLGLVELVPNFIGTLLGTLSVGPATGGTENVAGHISLTNIGDQPGWPRYLCYGPGTFLIADGPGSSNMVQFGPLQDGQIALLTTLPRLPAVTDLSPLPTNSTPQNDNLITDLVKLLVNFAVNNNIPPLLQEFESIFGILPPQGPLYSLLNGRFTTPIDPMLEQVGPVTSHIPCEILGGNANSKIIASLTPQRRWPE